MIRLIKETYAEGLFDLYLDSIRAEEMPVSDAGFDPGARKDLAQRRPEVAQIPAGQVFGSVRMLEDDGQLILFMVMGQEASDRYNALKVSQFVEFSSKADLGFYGHSGKYIAELDNAFTLHPWEIEDAVIVDAADPYTFMQLENIYLEEGNRFSQRTRLTDDLEKWQALFHIKEHELTCVFRSRDASRLMAPLWIPQLEMDLKRSDKLARALIKDEHPARESRTMRKYALEMDMASKKESEEKLSTYVCSIAMPKPEYQLETGPRGEIVLLPDERFVGRIMTVYCGDFAVFKGRLPKALILDNKKRHKLSILKESLIFHFVPRY